MNWNTQSVCVCFDDESRDGTSKLRVFLVFKNSGFEHVQQARTKRLCERTTRKEVREHELTYNSLFNHVSNEINMNVMIDSNKKYYNIGLRGRLELLGSTFSIPFF